jgi:hypothetical protein
VGIARIFLRGIARLDVTQEISELLLCRHRFSPLRDTAFQTLRSLPLDWGKKGRPFLKAEFPLPGALYAIIIDETEMSRKIIAHDIYC